MKKLFAILLAAASLQAAAQDNMALEGELKYAEYLVGNSRGAMAYSTLNGIIGSNPRCAKAYCLRAGAYLADGNCKSALRDINQALSISPSDAGCLWMKCKILYHQGKMRDAAQFLEKAMLAQPGFVDESSERKILATEIMAIGGSAIDALPLANSIQERSAKALRARGIAYTQTQMNEMAIRELSNAVDLDPALTDCILWRALAKYQAGERKQAIMEWEAALQKNDIRARQFLDKYK